MIRSLVVECGFSIQEKEKILYRVKDLIITKVNDNKNDFSAKYAHLEKYVVTSKNNTYSNGEIIIGPKPDGVTSVKQHGFTVFSIQGETAKNKLFIDLNQLSGIRLLYTAVSRAKYMRQIVFME